MTAGRGRAAIPAWSGKRVATARAHIAATLPQPCGQCSKPVKPTDAFVVGHIKARATHPSLTWVPSNWRAEHRECSDRTGQSVVIAKAKAQGRAEAEADFSHQNTPGQPPPLPFSLSQGAVRLPEPLEALRWHSETLAAYPWLSSLLEVPDDASVPYAMTPPAEDAVGSYGAQAISWIRETQGVELRWWQRLAITRQLEHRLDGSLCFRSVLESTPRRAGKSVRIRAIVLWRMAHSALFGEVQTVVHTGSDIAICREIQRQAWRWSEDNEWKVTRGNGKEAIESPDGDRWLVRAQDAVYGYDVCLGVVDEAWDVKPDTISEGLEPATLERSSPQVHITSTAHRRATSLMRTRLAGALSVENPRTLLLLWAAPADADPSLEATWRAASPHWSEDRRVMIEEKFAAATAGDVDQQADDLDPMSGFTAQYLNQWTLSAAPVIRGEAVVTDTRWAELTAPAPVEVPVAAAVESWFADGVSLAVSWLDGDHVTVSVSDHADLFEVALALSTHAYTGPVTVGASLLADPAWATSGVKVVKGQSRTGQAAAELQRLIGADEFRHDGGAHLTGQALALRVLPGADGPLMASKFRADAVKAAVWAATSARGSTIAKKRQRILVPSV